MSFIRAVYSESSAGFIKKQKQIIDRGTVSQIQIKLLLIALLVGFISPMASATEIESGEIQITSTGTVSESIGFRPDYIEFITAQQIESNNFDESDPTNQDCPDNVNGWSEGSVVFDGAGVDEQYAIGMFRNSDSTNGHRTTSSTSDVIKNAYSDQDGNECGLLEVSVDSVNSNGFTLDTEQKYSDYNEIIRYKAYQFPDNMDFAAGMKQITSEGGINVNLGFQPANLHIRAGQQIATKNSNQKHFRAPAGRSKGYVTLDQSGDVIDQQSIGTASSSDSTNAHRSIASDEYVLNSVYLDQNANLVDSSEPSRLRAKVTGADSSGFSMQVDDKWSGTDEVFLYRAWGQSYYEYDVGYTVYGYRNWASGEPNEAVTGEDCAEFYPDGVWNDIPCDDSSSFHSGLCEFGDGTYETTTSMSWFDARDECDNRGGHLAIINNGNENSYIESNFGNVWIGLSQNAGGSEPAGGWTWTSPGAGKFEIGFEPDAIDIYAEQQISSINNETTTPSNSGCSNAGGWSNGFYETDEDRQWALSTGRTSDSQNSHRYGSTTASAVKNLYSGQDGGNCGEFEGTVTGTSSSGFNMNFATRDGFEGNYGNEIVYYRAFNFLKAPPNVKSIDFYNSTENHKFGVRANISEGSNDVSSCQIQAEDSSSNSETYSASVSNINSTWSQCEFEWIRYDDTVDWETQHNNLDQLLSLDVTVTASDVDGLSDQMTSSNSFPNNRPSIERINTTESANSHAFRASADINYTDDENYEPGGKACEVILEGQNTGATNIYNSSEDSELTANFNYISGGRAECETNLIEPDNCGSGSCSGDFDYDIGESIDVEFRIFDHHGGQDILSTTEEIPNKPPVIKLINPTDNGLVLGEEAELKVDVSDPEGDSFNLSFTDEDTNSDLETIIDADQASNLEYNWEVGLGTFNWGVEVNDSFDNNKETWSFRRVVSQSFRLEKDIEYEYSSLILSEFSSSTLLIDITNNHPTPKNITTDIRSINGNVNASFASYDGGIYNLGSGESRRFQIQVSRDKELNGYTEDTIRINSTDQQIGAETVEEFPVYVRSSQQESRGVPGLTATMIYIIGLVSVLLFGLSV